ncbi:isoleucine--tRNA ligase [Candidatus Bealeia paramacronuclearis]
MKGDLPQKEPQILEKWEKDKLYEKLQKKAQGRPKFVLHDGPPYANGKLHTGHALNRILKDIVLKTHYKLGYLTPFVPGWDCHGLPIESEVEKAYREKGMNKDEVPLPQFLKECRAFASKWVDDQRRDSKRLGVLADWDNPYLTMDYSSESHIAGLLWDFLEKGDLYRGEKPVMWSVVEKTALAEAEVEYKDHTSSSIYVAFPIESSPIAHLKGTCAVIWTTTPWTLPGNRAIAYSPEMMYVLLEILDVEDGRLSQKELKILIAQDLLEDVTKNIGVRSYKVLETISGEELEGTIAHHPFQGQGYDFDVPLLPGSHVMADAGTGLVHTAPGHGIEDFSVGKVFGLELPRTVSEDGTYYAHVPLFAGLHVYKANGPVIEKLKEMGALLNEDKILHSYPHSWRSKTPLIYRTTPQWFISMEKHGLREKAVAAIQDVKWHPESSINRIRSMVEGRPDWCVSRQRTWGVPIALFVHKETGEPLQDLDVKNRILKAIAEKGSVVWFEEDPQVFLGEKYNAEDYEQIRDILDVWFDSAATSSFVLKARPELGWPADLYLEGSDQHRGWFQTSLLVSTGLYGKAPFKEVLTHGFLMYEDGEKMSKSKGNVIAPQEIGDKMGIDVLRLWVVGIDYGDDMRIGPEILKRQEDIYRRYRNTFRYLLGALEGYIPPSSFDASSLPTLEKWVLHRLKEIDLKVRESTFAYDFLGLYSEIHHFCSVDLSAFYFDIRKDALYCDDPEGALRQGVLWTFDQIFESLIRWLAPVISFTAEEAWHVRHPHIETSIHEELFTELPQSWLNPELSGKLAIFREARRVLTGALEIARNEKMIGSSLAAHVDVYLDESWKEKLQDADMAELSIVSSLTFHVQNIPSNAFQLEEVKGIHVVVSPASGEKCARCWKVLPEVGKSQNHPNLCQRCEEAVSAYDQRAA